MNYASRTMRLLAIAGAALAVAACGHAAAPQQAASPAAVHTAAAAPVTQSISGCSALMTKANQDDPTHGITGILDNPTGPCKGLTEAQLDAIMWNIDIPDATETVPASIPCYSALERTHPELLPVQLKDACGG